MKSNIIKLIISALLYICILKMPYGYYQIARIISMTGFLLLAYYSYEKNDMESVIILLSLSILFQPIIKIPIGRLYWNIIDGIVGTVLLLSIFIKSPKK